MSSENRVLDSFGPNLVIESNGNVGVGGQLAYQLYSVTDKGVVYQQALHGSGLATINAEQTLEIQTGLKNKSGRISYFAMAHHGDMCMTASDGWIRIKGQNIVLDATNELLLQGKHIILGNANKTTADTQILARKIEINGTKEVKITGATKITKESGNIFLKASHHKVMNGLAKAAFIPGQYKVGFGLRNLTLGDF